MACPEVSSPSDVSILRRASPKRGCFEVRPIGSAAFLAVSMQLCTLSRLCVRFVNEHGELVAQRDVFIFNNAVLDDLRKLLEFAPCLRGACAYSVDDANAAPLDLDAQALSVLSDLRICTGSTVYMRQLVSPPGAVPIGVMLPTGEAFASLPVAPSTPVGSIARLLHHMLDFPSLYSTSLDFAEGGMIELQADTFDSLPVGALQGAPLYVAARTE